MSEVYQSYVHWLYAAFTTAPVDIVITVRVPATVTLPKITALGMADLVLESDGLASGYSGCPLFFYPSL